MSKNNRGGWFGGNRSGSGNARFGDNEGQKKTQQKDKVSSHDKSKKDETDKVDNTKPEDTDVSEAEKQDAAITEAVVCELPPGARHGEKKFNGRCRLFVGNLERGTEEDELRQIFSPFGETGEVFVNKDKGFGFIRLDYRLNAERAKLTLDKKVVKGRPLQVRYALHASAIELHGLNQFASNEFVEQAMSQFGQVERVCIVCDDRGRSKGYAIVEFAWKKSAQKVLERFQDELFVLGRLPKPVYAKPYTQQDEEEGIHEDDLQRINGYATEREFNPRFISSNSHEFEWAKKWRDVFVEEEEKKARLDEEMRDARYRLEIEMENAMQEQEAMSMREALVADLQRRQEELRMFEEQMQRRRDDSMGIQRHAQQYQPHSRISGGRPSGGGMVESHDAFNRSREVEPSNQEDFSVAGFGDQVNVGFQLEAGVPEQHGLGESGMYPQMGHGERDDQQRFDKRPRRM